MNRPSQARMLLALLVLLAGFRQAKSEEQLALDEPPSVTVKDDEAEQDHGFTEYRGDVDFAAFQDPRPAPLTPPAPSPLPSPAVGREFQSVLGAFSTIGAAPDPFRSEMLRLPGGSGALSASLVDANTLLTTDLGDLLGETMSSRNVPVQSRNPTTHEPRPIGTQGGEVNVGGSYWFPARQDLDTAVSKVDSQLIENVVVIRGPYSARYGPGFSFIDFELFRSPRYNGPDWRGSTILDYKTNGQQWHGRQTISHGSTDWGATFGYSHRTGNDYETGAGFEIPSSFNSREANAAIGWDPTPDSSIEFSYLRLDQTNLEFPGQAFDIEFLVTDAFELGYQSRDVAAAELFEIEGWYNRTRFEGNSQRPGKRRQNPVLDEFNFFGTTDVDGASMGYTAALTWGDSPADYLTVGSDLRVLKQNINELNRFEFFEVLPPVTPFDPPFRRNTRAVDKTVPKSEATNPGLFAEGIMQVSEPLALRAGGRYDRWDAEVRDRNPVEIVQPVGFFIAPNPERIFVPIVPVQSFGVAVPAELLPEREFNLPSFYLSGDYRPIDEVTVTLAAGGATRAPTLTELYALNGPFLAVLQRGGNFVFGNPQLAAEKLWQIDLGFRADYGPIRGGVSGFHAWIEDYITYRPIVPIHALPSAGLGFPINVNDPRQFPFQAVEFTNTDLATLVGGEAFLETDVVDWLTAFGTLSYVQGTDRTRTESGTADFPIVDLRTGVPVVLPALVPEIEPLPGIAPLQSRLGIRLHPTRNRPPWEIEIAARVVDDQSRVARTLLEQETPGYAVWDARAFWRRTEQHLIVAGVENFTDRFYREHLDLRTGVFQPGVSFYLGSQLYY